MEKEALPGDPQKEPGFFFCSSTHKNSGDFTQISLNFALTFLLEYWTFSQSEIILWKSVTRRIFCYILCICFFGDSNSNERFSKNCLLWYAEMHISRVWEVIVGKAYYYSCRVKVCFIWCNQIMKWSSIDCDFCRHIVTVYHVWGFTSYKSTNK